MENTEIKFRKFMNEDMPYLFEVSLKNKSVLLNEPSTFSSLSQFSDFFFDRLNRVYHDFYIVSDQDGILGCVYTYDYRVYDANCRLFVSAERRHYDLIQCMADKLFNDYPLKKIFCWVRQDDFETKKAVEMISEIPEARLQEYIFANGTYLDVYVYGISRESFYNGK